MKKHIISVLVAFVAIFLVSSTQVHAASCDVYALSPNGNFQSSSSLSRIYSADAKCDGGVKSMRFLVNGNKLYENSNSAHIGYWWKAPSAGTYRLCFQVTGTDDSNAEKCMSVSSNGSTSSGSVLGTSTTTPYSTTTTQTATQNRFQNTTCPSTVSPRLSNGKSGHTLTAVNVRAAPGISSLKIGRLQTGTSFEVQSDPTCNGGINWWKIKIQEFTGVIAESQFGSYLLSP